MANRDRHMKRETAIAANRFGLHDMVLIKDNHIAACGGVMEALVCGAVSIAIGELPVGWNGGSSSLSTSTWAVK